MSLYEAGLAQVASQFGVAGLSQEHYQLAYGAALASANSAGGALYIDDTEAEEVRLKVEEPPDEFTRLSNHGFHELLDRFKETIGD